MPRSASWICWTSAAYTLTFRGSSADGFEPRRAFWAQADVPRRPHDLYPWLGCRHARAGDRALVAARALQGIGGAIVTPLTLTLLANAVAPERPLALGAWGAIGGLAVASGPLVGGAIVEWASWQWIFWLNVPIGLVLVPLAYARLEESRGKAPPS